MGKPGFGKSAIVAEFLHRNSHGRVLAFHCCQSNVAETLSPGRFVRSIAGMIASRHPAYETLLDRAPYRDVLAEPHCSRDPESALEEGVLAALRQVGPPAPGIWTLVVDALDEGAIARPDGGPTIVRMLASRIDSFPDWLRIVATSRPEKSVLDVLAGLKPVMLDFEDPRNLDDLRKYVRERLNSGVLVDKLSQAGRDAAWVTETLAQAAMGIFLYAQQALDALERNLLEVEELGTLPPGLSQQYQFFFERQFKTASEWEAVRPLFSVLVAAQDALSAEELGTAIDSGPKREVSRLLGQLASYLRKTGPTQPRYELIHKSLLEWLTHEDRQGGSYAIDPSIGHQLLADGLHRRYETDRLSLSAYTLNFLAYHMAESARGADSGRRADRQRALAGFVLDPMVQSQRLNDPLGMSASLRLALELAAEGPVPASVPTALQLALGGICFRRERLDATRLFKLAREGQLTLFERELQLYSADERWLNAARLVSAWLGKEAEPEAAEALRMRTRTGTVLDERVDAAFEGRTANFSPIDEFADESAATQILAQTGGTGTEGVNPSMLWEQAAPPPAGERMDAEGTRYLAEFQAPTLVAFAHHNPERGTQRLRDYIALNAANAYRVYRDGSLWQILCAVGRHPDPDWVRDISITILINALTGGGREFSGALGIALAGLRAAGDPELQQAFASAEQEALDALEKFDDVANPGVMDPVRGKGDSWGDHRRTLAAFAETRCLVFGEIVHPLLQRALAIPPGYAGFQAPTSVTLAETMAICGAPPDWAKTALHDAQVAAHNVQDLVFCGRSVSRVQGIVQKWWPGTEQDELTIASVIDRFTRKPHAAEFAALQLVGEQYLERRVVNPTSRLPSWFVGARTLRELSLVYQWPLAEFVAVNPEIDSADTALTDGMRVRVPDPHWSAMLAAFLASRVLSSKAFKPLERARLILRLVPAAMTNPTALDTVLSRLLLSLPPTELSTITEIEATLKALDRKAAA